MWQSTKIDFLTHLHANWTALTCWVMDKDLWGGVLCPVVDPIRLRGHLVDKRRWEGGSGTWRTNWEADSDKQIQTLQKDLHTRAILLLLLSYLMKQLTCTLCWRHHRIQRNSFFIGLSSPVGPSVHWSRRLCPPYGSCIFLFMRL